MNFNVDLGRGCVVIDKLGSQSGPIRIQLHPLLSKYGHYFWLPKYKNGDDHNAKLRLLKLVLHKTKGDMTHGEFY